MNSFSYERRRFLSRCAFEIAPVASVFPLWAAATFSAEPDADRQLTQQDETVLAKRWSELARKESAEITRRNIHGLMRAAHLYHDKHGSLPPAVIANPKLPAGKRLSGFVLLLPYLKADSWISKDKPCFEPDVVKLANDLYHAIDQTKAWDDSANLKAAKTILPAFLAPQSAPLRDKDGCAVSHFAFVQGSMNGPDGAFPGETGVKIADVTDGTVSTLGFGQIVNDLGPWIAEGLSTARQVFAPTAKAPGTFGSQYKSGCYFVMCDSSPFFHKLDADADVVLQKAATRSGGELLDNVEITRTTLPLEIDETQ